MGAPVSGTVYTPSPYPQGGTVATRGAMAVP